MEVIAGWSSGTVAARSEMTDDGGGRERGEVRAVKTFNISFDIEIKCAEFLTKATRKKKQWGTRDDHTEAAKS